MNATLAPAPGICRTPLFDRNAGARSDAYAVNAESTVPANLRRRHAHYRITNGFPIGSLDMFIQIVLGRV